MSERLVGWSVEPTDEQASECKRVYVIGPSQWASKEAASGGDGSGGSYDDCTFACTAESRGNHCGESQDLAVPRRARGDGNQSNFVSLKSDWIPQHCTDRFYLKGTLDRHRRAKSSPTEAILLARRKVFFFFIL